MQGVGQRFHAGFRVVLQGLQNHQVGLVQLGHGVFSCLFAPVQGGVVL